MKKLKEHKKDLILFIIVFLVSIVMCGAFLQPHYTHDTYAIINDGYETYSYDKFLKEARPFTAIATLLANIIKLPIEEYMIISFIFALIFLSGSVVIVYNIFKNKFTSETNWINLLIVLISFVTIFNYLAIEHIFFLECGILALGILLSVIATKIIINKEKYAYAKSTILIIIAVFCYQGSIAIFPMILLTYKLLFEKNEIKKDVVDTIKMILIYGVAMLLTILFSQLIMGGSRIRIYATQIDIQYILSWLKELVISSLGVIPSYINMAIIVLSAITILIFYKENVKKKILYMLKYLFIIVASIGICMAPIFLGSGLNLTPRMCVAYGNTIGISLLTVLFIIYKNKKYQLVIFSIILTAIFIMTIVLYSVLTNQHILTNQLDKIRCENIKDTIEKYEKEKGVEVTKIAIAIDSSKIYYPNMIEAGAITQNALNSWACRISINYYIGRKLTFEPMTHEKYIEVFDHENTTKPIVIEGNTLYFNGGS